MMKIDIEPAIWFYSARLDQLRLKRRAMKRHLLWLRLKLFLYRYLLIFSL